MANQITNMAQSCQPAGGVLNFAALVALDIGETGPHWVLEGQAGPAQGFLLAGGFPDLGPYELPGLPNGTYLLTVNKGNGQTITESVSQQLVVACLAAVAFAPRSTKYRVAIRPCPPAPARPYYLRWLSALGNWEGWLFSGEADTKNGVSEASSTTSQEGITTALARAGQEAVTVRAGGLTTAQHRALATILTSPQVYLEGPDGARLPVYLVDNSSTSRSTSEGRHVIQLDILLPAANSLTN